MTHARYNFTTMIKWRKDYMKARKKLLKQIKEHGLRFGTISVHEVITAWETKRYPKHDGL